MSNRAYCFVSLIILSFLNSCSIELVESFTGTLLGEQTVVLNDASNTRVWSNLDVIEKLDSTTCNRFQCFDSSRCQLDETKQLSYYVYPPLRIIDSSGNVIYSTSSMISFEYWKLLETLLKSDRLTVNPEDACIFVPSIDLTWVHANQSSRLFNILESLPYWRYVDGYPGTNHLIISLDPTFDSNKILSAIERAILISPTHDTWTLRSEFDLSIPVLVENRANDDERHQYNWSIITTQFDSFSEDQRLSISNLKKLLNERLLVLGSNCSSLHRGMINFLGEIRCSKEDDSGNVFKFPEVFLNARYCLLLNVGTPSIADAVHYLLAEAIQHGCVPIVTSDYILPFNSLIDWSSISILLTNDEILESLEPQMSSINDSEHARMSNEARQVWSKHFKNSSQIASDIARHYDSLVYPRAFLGR